MRTKEKCTICNDKITLHFNPMDEWEMKGPICGKCYSAKINKHYPGDHVRVNKDK